MNKLDNNSTCLEGSCAQCCLDTDVDDTQCCLGADVDDAKSVKSTVAMFRNFSPEKPIENSVVYFWESHTKNPDDKVKTQATIDLIYKKFDMSSCEKYEVRTGYLSRFNYLKPSFHKATPADMEEAIIKGKEEENEWISRCSPNLPGFIQKKWQDCISERENRYFEECKVLITNAIKSNETFAAAFDRSVNDYATRHETNEENGSLYMLEETSWILSLVLKHLNKQIYLIHVGKSNPAIREMFNVFPALQNAVRWLSPRFLDAAFINTADFLMYYSTGYAGCSYAAENKDIVMAINSFKNPPKEELLQSLSKEISEKNLLHSIIGKLPGHVYWLNRDNIYMGCNNIQAKSFGLKSKNEILGKTNYDLHSPNDAEELNKINNTVMETGKPYEAEEVSTMQGKSGQYLSHKTPLFDIDGKVIGLLGISIDITDRKKAEELELKNKLQATQLGVQEEFRQFTSRMAHDIISPLASLELILNSCKNLPERQHVLLRNAVTNIKNISGALLNRYRKNLQENSLEKKQYILVALALAETLQNKRYEYKRKNVDINYSFDQSLNFTFVEGDQSNFSRMISNLINNSIEAFEDKPGTVTVTLNVEGSIVKITIKDTGKGMPKGIVDKILKNEHVETTKITGHGIGLGQVKDTLSLYGGKMEIDSQEGVGTTITITFPISEAPTWIADRVAINSDNTVIILDNDEAIYDILKERLNGHSNDLTLKFFTRGKDATNFINSVPVNEKAKLFLLSDYDLREANSGLDVVLASGMQNQSIIVTSIHNDQMVQDFIRQSGIKMLPKQFLNYVPIVVE